MVNKTSVAVLLLVLWLQVLALGVDGKDKYSGGDRPRLPPDLPLQEPSKDNLGSKAKDRDSLDHSFQFRVMECVICQSKVST